MEFYLLLDYVEVEKLFLYQKQLIGPNRIGFPI